MVQVDIFWSYGIGAGFAFAAGRQLIARHEAHDESNKGIFNSMYFTKALLFLALLFAPSGIWLLWSVPSWETMHVGTYDTIPGWLVVLFAITNITQGILGYWVTSKLFLKGRHYLASLQMPLAYFGMFFILVNGWDKLGYQRFFSATKEDFLNWSWSNVSSWLTSEVVLILGICGVFIIPLMLYWASTWLKEGYKESDEVDRERAASTSRMKLIVLLLASVFVGALGLAVVATFLIYYLDWALGLVVFAAVFGLLGISKWGVFHFLYDQLFLPKEAT